MANNPMFGTASQPTQKTTPINSVNESHKKYYQGRNTFNYSRPVHLTARYADVTPFEAIHAVEGDILEIGNTHEIQTHTLKSPLKSEVYMKKFYGQVDMKAILPRTWNKFYINPNFGDDIIPEDVNTFSSKFYNYFLENASSLNRLTEDITDETQLELFLNHILHMIILYEAVFSDGSILSNLGCHAGSMAAIRVPVGNSDYEYINIDLYLEKVFSTFFDLDSEYSSFNLKVDPDTDDERLLTFSYDSQGLHDLLTFIRHYHNWYFYVPNLSAELNFDDLETVIYSLLNFFKYFYIYKLDDNVITPLNYDVLVAYQIICATFYSRDSVDNIYSAETFRDVQDFLWLESLVNNGNALYSIDDFLFTYNGNRYLYDAHSGKVFNHMLSYLFYHATSFESVVVPNVYDHDHLLYPYAYFMNIFGYNPSLRYGDYFTGSRLEPLAVGDINAPVTAEGVNAIDMTIALSRARFFNAVNRAGRRPEDYVEDVMNGVLPPEITEPRFLASHTSKVKGFEVENTSEDQGNLVTILRSSGSNKIYSLAVGHPCIVIGVCTFEIQRVYTKSCDRFFFHKDRFDIFNKFMQYNGDQPIMSVERNMTEEANLSSPSPFAYTGRYMEYKQRVPIASGGFINFLPGYLFITDREESLTQDDRSVRLDDDYIRSKNYEIDTFYKSLTNYSLAGYFHFILDFQNICIAHRQMDYSPSIL